MYPSLSVDCEILRDCYESFAMYCFGRYLVACLGMSFSTTFMNEKEFISDFWGHSFVEVYAILNSRSLAPPFGVFILSWYSFLFF